MKSSASPRIALSVRAKILILFLALSLVALSLTGYFAFSAITNVGSYAQGSSEALGKGVVNDRLYCPSLSGRGVPCPHICRPGKFHGCTF